MLENASGRWAGDNISIMGDDLTPDWERITEEYVDIEANAILTVFHSDGFDDIRECAANNECFFVQLCHMVITRQAPELGGELKRMIGGSIQERYTELWKKGVWFQLKNVVP